MSGRKKIGLIMANPESTYQQRLLTGIFEKCALYGYDVAVFCPLVNAQHYDKKYRQGELNIFELINFDSFDGFIVATLTLSVDNNRECTDRIARKIKESGKPAVALDLPFGGFETICTDDRTAIADLTEHMVGFHGCRDIMILAGMKDYPVTEERLAGIKDTLDAHNIPLDESMIYYGDFWYSGGEALGDKIISGEIHKPEAVIAMSDHMAVGLAGRLIENGIRVPEDILISGFDCVPESAVLTPSITSYVPMAAQAAKNAVARLHELMENLPHDTDEKREPEKDGLFIGNSCGCPENFEHVKEALSSVIYNISINYGKENVNYSADVGRMLESYMLENLTAVDSPDKCLYEIFKATYLITPYERFFLCLSENWTDMDNRSAKGYPDKMKSVIDCRFENNDAVGRHSERASKVFDTGLMLPELWQERDKPMVFYFAPVHFNENTFGYAVLQCPLDSENRVSIVFRNWIRNVNNAIELVCVRSRLTVFSQRDAMTGLYNRRGMEARLREMLSRTDAKGCIAFVIDMDGLKYINDNYGHSEGDYGIKSIAAAAQFIAQSDEICARAGGDEFYIIGIGDYRKTDVPARIAKFMGVVSAEGISSSKPYKISASIGGAYGVLSENLSVDDIIRQADANMYKSKTACHHSRLK